MNTDRQEVTQLLLQANTGDESARRELLQVTYEELRRMARGYFAGERRDHTLQPTALVNELQIRLLGKEALPGANRRQFFSFAAKAMRHLLVDHARTRGRQKRGGDAQKLPLDEGLVVGSEPDMDLLALDEALERCTSYASRTSTRPISRSSCGSSSTTRMRTGGVVDALESEESGLGSVTRRSIRRGPRDRAGRHTKPQHRIS